MIVARCIFQENTPEGRDIGIAGTIIRKHKVTNCVLAESELASEYGSGDLNTVTVTATHSLPENDMTLCFASLCPTPECEIRDGGCCAAKYTVPAGAWCCVWRNVAFVDLCGLAGSLLGGAISGQSFDGVEMSGCTFLRCFLRGSSSSVTMTGGAAYFNGLTGEIAISDCCATDCFAH
jgi:hypothetical protein